jgi:PAS domain S-box-containing protein
MIEPMIPEERFNLELKVVELTCLERILDLGKNPDVNLNGFFDQVVNYIPIAMKDYLIIFVKLEFDSKTYKSSFFQQTQNQFEYTLNVSNNLLGFIKIFFHKNKISPYGLDYNQCIEKSLKSIAKQLEKVIGYKISQRKVADSQNQLRLLVKNMPVMISVYDENWNYIVWNPECERVTGYTKADLDASDDPEKLFFPDDEYRTKMLQKYFNSDHSYYDVEWITRCKNGDIKTLAWYDISGRFPIPGWSSWAVGIDVTERNRGKEILKESNERLEHALDTSGHALWDFDVKSQTAFVSSRFFPLIGYPSLDKCNLLQTWEKSIHLEDKAAFFNSFDQCIKKNDSFEIEFRMLDPNDNKIWILCRGKTVSRDNSGTALRVVGTHLDISKQKQKEETLIIKEKKVRERYLQLQSLEKHRYQFQNIVGKTAPMQEVYDNILMAASNKNSVVITGESGTGKELVARAIHDLSERSKGRFVAVNCAALTETILESELFGHEKGAFTGATKTKEGLINLSDGGTLFLDEIGDISLNMQTKLLRVLEGSGFTPVGGVKTVYPDFRLVTAMNNTFEKMLEESTMRQDFYYRICVIPIRLPPLRERKEDIPLLIDYFVKKSNSDSNNRVIPLKIQESLMEYDWPGNIRELQNVLHRYFSMNKLEFLGNASNEKNKEAHELKKDDFVEAQQLRSFMKSTEKKYIQDLLTSNRWNISKTANLLGINRKTLYRKLNEHNLK